MKMEFKLLPRILPIALASAGCGVFAAQDYSPFVDRKGLESVYWGDTHLHTAYSTDAGMIGNTLSPDQAYDFARGEEVTSSTGVPARLWPGTPVIRGDYTAATPSCVTRSFTAGRIS